MSNQATRLAELIAMADKCIAWHEAGFPIEDPYDTFPDDLWEAMTSPERLKPFLVALLALVQPAVSEEAEGGQRRPADADFPWPRLLKPAHVCGATFGVGVSSRLVVECAQRHASYKAEEAAKTPEQRQVDEVNRRALWDMINGAPAPVSQLSDVHAEQAQRTVYSTKVARAQSSKGDEGMQHE